MKLKRTKPLKQPNSIAFRFHLMKCNIHQHTLVNYWVMPIKLDFHGRITG